MKWHGHHPGSPHKKSYKACRDCGAGMEDVDLYLRGSHVYCAEDYQARFGTWPDGREQESDLDE